jgi:hypothetical protein
MTDRRGKTLVERTMGVGLRCHNDLPKPGDPTVVPEKLFGSITVVLRRPHGAAGA